MRKSLQRFVLYPMLFLSGCHLLMTGSPIPLWHIERLANPQKVQSIAESHLQLEDGRTIALPFMKGLPKDNPLFQKAVSHGIEIDSKGEAFGLMWLDRNCGNDPCLWRRIRVNLSDLAAGLNPDGIEDSLLHPDLMPIIKEYRQIDQSSQNQSHRNLHLTIWDFVSMRSIRQDFEAADTKRRELSRPGVE